MPRGRPRKQPKVETTVSQPVAETAPNGETPKNGVSPSSPIVADDIKVEIQPLSLEKDIRPALIRQEETIIFSLIERSQYPLNKKCYLSGNVNDSAIKQRMIAFDELVKLNKNSPSLLDYFLCETEKFQAKLGRFSAPDEHAFFPAAIKATTESFVANKLKANPDKKQLIMLKPNDININSEVMKVYLDKILPEMSGDRTGDDSDNFGSSCVCDIAVLQAISKRIHFGKFVAEAKFQSETDKFSELIRKKDTKGLMAALTHVEVEKKVIERVKFKASHYGTDGSSNKEIYKVDPELIARLYEEYLIPLNKDVQVEYLLKRLD